MPPIDIVKPQNDVLRNSLAKIEEYAASVMANLVDVHFTDHSISHLRRIITIAGTLLEQNNKSDFLSDPEKYVLYASILLHDIGMQYEAEGDSAEKRRARHHHTSAQIVRDDWKDIGIIQHHADTIALIVEGHRGTIDERYITKIVGTSETLRCDLLAALLCLCDELDISFERVDIRKLRYQNYDGESALHFYKHYFTQGILIGDDRCIHIVFRYPSEERKLQYAPLFEPLVSKKLESIIKTLTPILQNKYGVFVALPKKNITHCIDSTLESIHPTLFEEIFSTSMGLSNFTLLQRQNFRQYVGDINAELFYKGNVRWADIVNDLDIRRAQYDEILSAMKEVYSKSIADQTITCLLICGEAGSGKTTSLMRLAYDSLSNQDLDSAQLLMLAPGAPFDFSQIQGLHNSSISPVIVFVDGFSIQSIVDSFREYLAKSAPINLPLVLVVASRMNEWQNAGGNTVKFSKQINVQLKTLTDSEITQLLEKLDHHNQLYELTPLDQVGRFNKLKDKSSGQLLVAMLEATRGKRFHEIVLDEYQKVREDYPEAARAYELVSLFYFYDVLMPQELLITLVACCDYEDFESRVLQHTYLIIVKHEVTQYGIQYRPRHKEIARILIDSLPDYEFGEKRLRQSSVVLRTLEAADRKQRYVILNFLNNYATSIIKTVSKSDYDFRLNEIRHFLGRNMPKINRMQDQASGGKFVSELVQWSRLFKFLRMQSELISILRRILSLEPFDRMTNYRLAQALQRTREGKDHPEIVADAYKNSFIGGNRRTMFIYEYLSYCLKYGLLNHFDSIMGSVRDFVSFSSEEEDIRDKLIALLNGYRIRKDQAELANRFTSIVAHVEATKDLSAEDEIEYIDKVEVQDIRTTLNDLETHLITISPTRPKGILLRIAHLGSRIPGEEDKAIAFYKEYYDLYVKQNPQKEQHMAVFEYVTFAAKRRLQTKAMNYSLFKLCITLNPVYLNTYFEFCDYAHDCGDDQVAAEYGNQGLKIASQTDRFNSIEARQIRHLLETL